LEGDPRIDRRGGHIRRSTARPGGNEDVQRNERDQQNHWHGHAVGPVDGACNRVPIHVKCCVRSRTVVCHLSQVIDRFPRAFRRSTPWGIAFGAPLQTHVCFCSGSQCRRQPPCGLSAVAGPRHPESEPSDMTPRLALPAIRVDLSACSESSWATLKADHTSEPRRAGEDGQLAQRASPPTPSAAARERR
jgi:hypothetical protein